MPNFMTQILKDLLQEATAKGTRSSALQPLLWLVALLCFAFMGLAKLGAPEPLMWAVVVLLSVVIIAIVVAFLVLLVKNPDALRSERYTMYKMALERGIFGDSSSGLLKNDEVNNLPDNTNIVSDEVDSNE